MNRKDICVALLLGGTSSERDVSLMTGKSIYEALKRIGYRIKIVDPGLGVNQYSTDEDYFKGISNHELSDRNYLSAVNSNLFDGVDIAFNALHGKWGEDGAIQSLLEIRSIPYTGSGVLACSISMNKAFSKVMFLHDGVQTPRWIVVNKNEESIEQIKLRINKTLGYPCVVKPNDQGSAIGLTICKEESQLEEAIKLSDKYSTSTIIEEYIDGYEVTVGVINEEVLPVIEIKPKHDFYDYECKYTHGMSEYEVPANLPEKVTEHLQQQALLAYNSIGCKTYGRIDFRVSKEYKTYCLEINTLPGMTSTSLLPKAAKADGISFEDLVDRIIISSLQK